MSRDWEFVTVAFGDSRDLIAEQAARRSSSGGFGEVNLRTLSDSVGAVESGQADHTLVAIQDSLGAEAPGVLNALDSAAHVFVVGEVVTELRASLLTLKDAKMASLRTVVGLQGVLDSLAGALSPLEVDLRVTRDLAREARLMEERNDRHTALLAPEEYAEQLGLHVARANLGGDRRHWVRHWVLGQAESLQSKLGTRSAFVLGPVFGARTMKTLRTDLQSRGASCVRIADRRGQVGEEFLVEFDHEPGQGEVTMFEAARFCRFRHLGSWSPDVGALTAAA